MTATLPLELRDVFARYLTTEYTTVDARGRPITWPVTPYYADCAETIDVTTGLGYPKKANDARANPMVSLLFSDPKGSGMQTPSMVLVQGIAHVDDSDLGRNRERFTRESQAKLPGFAKLTRLSLVQKMAPWYFTRIYVLVRPERIFAWPDGDPSREPRLHDTHMDEVRTGHFEEPEVEHAAPEGGRVRWDDRVEQLGSRYPTAAVSWVAPDGFPACVRLPVAPDPRRRLVLLRATPAGIPLAAGPACVAAHDHDERFSWQINFQVRGDLACENGEWAVIPHHVLGGFEMPRGLRRWTGNARKMWRFQQVARREAQERSRRS